MAAATVLSPQLSLDEYLHTVYKPDCDFVDGHLEERNMGELEHGLLQIELGYWFRLHRDEWNIRVVSELRTRVSAQRVRIPDITVYRANEGAREQVRITPALLAIEILSPEDRIPRVLVRLNDFLQMGVKHIWLIDPEERIAYTYREQGLQLVQEPRLSLPDSPIYLDLPELFKALD